MLRWILKDLKRARKNFLKVLSRDGLFSLLGIWQEYYEERVNESFDYWVLLSKLAIELAHSVDELKEVSHLLPVDYEVRSLYKIKFNNLIKIRKTA